MMVNLKIGNLYLFLCQYETYQLVAATTLIHTNIETAIVRNIESDTSGSIRLLNSVDNRVDYKRED